MVLLTVMFVFCSLLCGALAVPLILERVPMNRWYGVRIAKSFESDRNWYALNRFGGWQLLAYSVALGLLGVALLFVPRSPERWLHWLLLLAPVWLLVPVVWRILAFARRLPAAEADAGAGREPAE